MSDVSFPRLDARRTLTFAGTTLVLFGVAAAVLHPRWLRAGHFVEAVAYGVLASFFVGYAPIRNVIDHLGGRGRVALAALSGLFFLGQMFGGGRHIFPMVRFAMFTDPVHEPAPGVFYQATFQDGSRRVLQPAEMVPPACEGRFESMTKYQMEKLRDEGRPPGTWPDTLYGRTVKGMLASYNAMHPDAPIVRLDVSSCCTELEMDGPRPRARRTELFTLPVPEGPHGSR